MLSTDGSSHQWVDGQWWDLIVTMDDASSEIYAAFFVDEEGTMSSFQGLYDVIRSKGLFSSFYTDRGHVNANAAHSIVSPTISATDMVISPNTPV